MEVMQRLKSVISTATLCRSRYFLFRHKFQVMTRTHGIPNPDGRHTEYQLFHYGTVDIFFATCRTCSGVYRCGCVWSHALPNPDGKDHRPPATFARERKGTFRANRTDLPNPGGTGTDPERRNTTTKRKKKRKKTKNKKERHKKKEQRQEEKKSTPTQETQQEQEHSNNTPKPKLKTQEKTRWASCTWLRGNRRKRRISNEIKHT